MGVTKVPKNVTVSKLRGNPMSRFVPLCKRTRYNEHSFFEISDRIFIDSVLNHLENYKKRLEEPDTLYCLICMKKTLKEGKGVEDFLKRLKKFQNEGMITGNAVEFFLQSINKNRADVLRKKLASDSSNP